MHHHSLDRATVEPDRNPPRNLDSSRTLGHFQKAHWQAQRIKFGCGKLSGCALPCVGRDQRVALRSRCPQPRPHAERLRRTSRILPRVTTQSRFYTIKGTADVLATSPTQVYALLRRGQPRGSKVGGRGQWWIGRDVVEAFIAHVYDDTATWVADNPFDGDGDGCSDNRPPGDVPSVDRPGDA